MLQSKQAAATQ